MVGRQGRYQQGTSEGFTLPEVLLTMALTGTLLAALWQAYMLVAAVGERSLAVYHEEQVLSSVLNSWRTHLEPPDGNLTTATGTLRIQAAGQGYRWVWEPATAPGAEEVDPPLEGYWLPLPVRFERTP